MKVKIKATGEIKKLSLSSFSFDPDFENEYTGDNGNYYKESEIERIPGPPIRRVEKIGWLVRDYYDYLYFDEEEPTIDEEGIFWALSPKAVELPKDMFPEITLEQDPKKARFEITLINEDD